MDPETLHHLANAITALRAAWNTCEGDKVYAHIIEAENSVFRAIREIANGQVAPDEAKDEA